MSLEDRAREWLDTHVSDTEGRDDIVRSLTDLLREVRTAGMLKAAEIAEPENYWIAEDIRTAAGSKP